MPFPKCKELVKTPAVADDSSSSAPASEVVADDCSSFAPVSELGQSPSVQSTRPRSLLVPLLTLSLCLYLHTSILYVQMQEWDPYNGTRVGEASHPGPGGRDAT